MNRPALARRLLAEFTGLQLPENTLATAAGLAVIIVVPGPVSGAHLNPVVSVADWVLGRRTGTGLPGRDVAAYAAAQTAGGPVPGFIVAQAAGGLLGAVLVLVLFPVARSGAGNSPIPAGRETAAAGAVPPAGN